MCIQKYKSSSDHMMASAAFIFILCSLNRSCTLSPVNIWTFLQSRFFFYKQNCGPSLQMHQHYSAFCSCCRVSQIIAVPSLNVCYCIHELWIPRKHFDRVTATWSCSWRPDNKTATGCSFTMNVAQVKMESCLKRVLGVVDGTVMLVIVFDDWDF